MERHSRSMSNEIVAIDIETYPNLDLVDLLPPIQADTRLKDEEKIAKNIEEKREKQLSQMALNALYGKIACIGYYGDSICEVHIDTEEQMLRQFFDFCDKLGQGKFKIVSWNGNNFDLPFIVKRGVALDLCSLDKLRRYTEKHNPFHYDLMNIWCGYNQYEKLDVVARVLLGEEKEEFDVSEVAEHLKTDTGKELLKRYCLRDCELVYKLYRKFYK